MNFDKESKSRKCCFLSVGGSGGTRECVCVCVCGGGGGGGDKNHRRNHLHNEMYKCIYLHFKKNDHEIMSEELLKYKLYKSNFELAIKWTLTKNPNPGFLFLYIIYL